MGYGPPNRFLSRDGDGGEPLRRVYARVDSVDPPGAEAEGQVIQLDAVDARRFDRLEPGMLRDEEIRQIGLAILEIHSAGRPDGWRADMPQVLEEGRWLEATLDVESGPWSVLYYANLFAEGSKRPADIKVVGDDLKKKLDEAFTLADVPDVGVEQIGTVLARADAADFVNVLDVGQGGACALWRSGNGAQLYFDLGGGVTSNVRTFPSPDRPMCLTQRPPVVLSHWDWDHWSSAFRYDDALKCTWVAPRQKLGAVHRAFAYELHQRGQLWIWPSRVRGVRGARVTVGKCTGTTRNDSGLAMWVHVPQSDGSEHAILLPGDTEYLRLPVRPQPWPLHAAVVSHHGADLDSIAACVPGGLGSALVYSYGEGNTFHHPAPKARAGYGKAGWTVGRTFQTANPAGRRPFDVAIPITSMPAVTGCGVCGPSVVT